MIEQDIPMSSPAPEYPDCDPETLQKAVDHLRPIGTISMDFDMRKLAIVCLSPLALFGIFPYLPFNVPQTASVLIILASVCVSVAAYLRPPRFVDRWLSVRIDLNDGSEAMDLALYKPTHASIDDVNVKFALDARTGDTAWRYIIRRVDPSHLSLRRAVALDPDDDRRAPEPKAQWLEVTDSDELTIALPQTYALSSMDEVSPEESAKEAGEDAVESNGSEEYDLASG